MERLIEVMKMVKVVVDIPKEVLEDLLERAFDVQVTRVTKKEIHVEVRYRHYIKPRQEKKKPEDEVPEDYEFLADRVVEVVDEWPL